MINVDWAGIRHLDGSQSAGFETLCAQLARAESPINAGFVRKGAPDAGVECYCILPDASEWGWQAKYFRELRNSSWSQIDESVRKALDKHPKLVRYFVCVPIDRADARLEGRTSALERWDQHVVRWKAWSRERGMDVEFVWWGSSELRERLSHPQHIGRLYFWFGEKGFDRSWFENRLDEALRTAGPRYTPELHVELDIGQQLEQFGRTKVAIDRLKSHAVEIRRRLQSLRHLGATERDLLSAFDLDAAVSATDDALDRFAALDAAPAGELPLSEIADRLAVAESLVDEIVDGLHEMGREYDAQRRRDGWNPRYGESPQVQLARSFSRLGRELDEARYCLIVASEFVNSRLLIVNGTAGTGKTHLLCDFARSRVDSGVPCVLLMGQRFTEAAEPWGQVLRQVGMHGDEAEHFVGALEAAAQAANSRALVIIDALNEGRGREVWWNHLEAFLAPLEKSEWIGVVLSVRATYEKVVIPERVRERAASVTHLGFEGYEYDATRTFFAHYGLEFPSAPVLHPEYRNPLYLKTICEGLSRGGHTRLPRGFHGITSAFNLYLDAVNKQLAETLDYNPQDNLVRRALNSIARQFLETRQRWLPRERAERRANELLPGRDYSRSLYFGLITSGALVADLDRMSDDPDDEVVFIGYERFADHIVADSLLKELPAGCALENAFEAGGQLAFLKEDRWGRHRGLVEALCIQAPEQTGQELLEAVPEFVNYPNIGELFLESVIWRRLDAFSDDTTEVLKRLMARGTIREEPIDTWLTVSTIAGHPFNAEFLDRRLRRDAMPDRDIWWSTYLHYAWSDNGPVERLVDWALGVSPDDALEPAVVDLAATSLAWMLTTPNRFLRDRATKALVSLLTGRVRSAGRLVERFADTDDPYVTERVYAVAYGVAMRSQDLPEVGALARLVYEKAFLSGFPPAHILLRGYARGVVERGLYLGADIYVDEMLIRSSYQSTWPDIPDEDAVEELIAQHDRLRSGSWLVSSVMDGDFAIYEIGIRRESDWLSVPLGQERWLSPPERLDNLLSKLTDAEQAAWEEYQDWEASRWDEFQSPVSSDDIGGSQWDRLLSSMTDEHRIELEAICQNGQLVSTSPRFDVRLIQRYILWRVFDLGWTEERFGHFDGMVNRNNGREARKAERIGKKYQWIAYHEILAYIADHYQYWRHAFLSLGYGDREYEGPWQDLIQDIDPSWILPPGSGGTTEDGRIRSWRGKPSFETWSNSLSDSEWLDSTDDIPDVPGLLEVVCPDDGRRWLRVDSFFTWEQPHPADVAPFDVERRQFWLRWDGFFIRGEDIDRFTEWCLQADDATLDWYRSPEIDGVYIGEYGWAPAFKYLEDDWDAYGEMSPHSDWPEFIRPAAIRYFSKPSDFDCSNDSGDYVGLPHYAFVRRLGLKWSGTSADFMDDTGELASFYAGEQGNDSGSLFLRRDLVDRYHAEEDLVLCWVVQGEKRIIGGGAERIYKGRNTVTGVYRLTVSGLEGRTVFNRVLPPGTSGGAL